MFGPSRRVARRSARRTSRRVMRRQAMFEDAQGGYEDEPEEAPPAPESDVTAELKRLSDLHAQGALTDEEFSAAKAKLLGI